MSRAEDLAPKLKRFPSQRLCFVISSFRPQHHRKVINTPKRVWMPVAENLALNLQRLSKQRFSLPITALIVEQRCRV